MQLEQQANIVNSIRSTLESYVGKRLHIRANMGRSKIVESDGILKQAHPQLFIMEIEHKRGRTTCQSYQYVDILTGTVQLGYDGESLFDELLELIGDKPEDKPVLDLSDQLLD